MGMRDKYDVIIIGGGPAGVSAALYTLRAGLSTAILMRDEGTLGKVAEIENYYGFSAPVSGKALAGSGLEGAIRLGADILRAEVVGVEFLEDFSVKTKDTALSARAVIMATGSSRKKAGVAGLERFEGSGVSYCALCDAYYHRGKDVAVLGAGAYALHEAVELSHIVRSVTLLTNTAEPEEAVPENIRLDKRKISSLEGEDKLERIIFADGESLSVSGLFIALGVAGAGDIAKSIGALTDGKYITVDEKMMTNVPGLFAAGDCTGGLLQVSKAVYQGALAGDSAVKLLRK